MYVSKHQFLGLRSQESNAEISITEADLQQQLLKKELD
jgi:hypothetical protein